MKEENCLFCNSAEMELHKVLSLNARDWFVVRDKFPVGRGHVLIILKRHHPDVFDISWPEWKELQDILEHAKRYLDEEFDPDGYNIGVNCGEAAGQTVSHLHIHLIPRYNGDVGDPRGGIRNFKKPLIEPS
jgi:diadenosine tetraphosphate (Ap4A) HIT family hydrolase